MRLAATMLVAVLAGAACSAGTSPSGSPNTATPTGFAMATPTVGPAGSLGPTREPSHPAPSATTGVVPSGDLLGLADAACRASSFRELDAATISWVISGIVTIVYADPEGDMICQWLPRYGDTAVVQGGFTHLADALSAEVPMVRDGNLSYTSETGAYVWGAVSPVVAKVMVEFDDLGRAVQATIENGYFLAVLTPGIPCCVFTVIAYGADGTELARAD